MNIIKVTAVSLKFYFDPTNNFIMHTISTIKKATLLTLLLENFFPLISDSYVLILSIKI